jgi:hypothetical protein
MLDEQMDDMIRDAASKHHPSYNDAGWDKMEKLLDKHLPHKKNKRSFFYLFLLFLLVGSSTYFGLMYFSGKNKLTSTLQPVNKASEYVADANKNSGPAANGAGINQPSGELPLQQMTPVGTVQNGSNSNVVDSDWGSGALAQGSHKGLVRIDKGKNIIRITSPALAEDFEPVNELPVSANANIRGKATVGKEQPDLQPDQVGLITGVDKSKNIRPSMINEIEKDTLTGNSGKNIEQPVVGGKNFNSDKLTINTTQHSTSPKNKKRKQSYIPGNFGLSFSLGPDISFVKVNKPGKLTMTYGVGLGYTFANRLTVKSGFYVSKKIYSSDSANYHPPGTFWYYYPNMKNIDANCKVYEIPLDLAYTFGKRGNHSWFAGGGLSSLLMKTETYEYDYKNASGQSAYRTYTYKNKNNHYFSVLGLSAGYQYQVNKSISVSAVPYVKLPLTGIGFGKVKLKGAGIMFTATVKPFTKKE